MSKAKNAFKEAQEDGNVTPKLSKKDELMQVLHAEEQANLAECSKEIATTLQKYGYELFIEQSIKIRKNQ